MGDPCRWADPGGWRYPMVSLQRAKTVRLSLGRGSSCQPNASTAALAAGAATGLESTSSRPWHIWCNCPLYYRSGVVGLLGRDIEQSNGLTFARGSARRPSAAESLAVQKTLGMACDRGTRWVLLVNRKQSCGTRSRTAPALKERRVRPGRDAGQYRPS